MVACKIIIKSVTVCVYVFAVVLYPPFQEFEACQYEFPEFTNKLTVKVIKTPQYDLLLEVLSTCSYVL